MSGELVRQQLIDDFVRNGDLSKLLQSLEKNNTSPAKSSSRARRLADWSGIKDSLPLEKVNNLRKRMTNFVTKKFAQVDITEPRVLTEVESEALMNEFLDAELIREALDARRLAAKRMVFNSLTSSNKEEGIENPEHHNGSIDVPQLSKRFVREGTGRTEPILNLEVLRSLLRKEDWEKITTRTLIPEKEVFEIDNAQLADFIHADPRRLELIRQALIPGDWKTPRFQVRDI